tara:strand:- start:525 stop:1628 length:1104 start_codon:yes stop_codon:yes gene_type:complete
MSLFATEDGPTWKPNTTEEVDSEEERCKEWDRERKEQQDMIDRAIYRFTPEYLKEHSRLIHYVERSIFFDKQKKKHSRCVTMLKEGERGVVAKMQLFKGWCTVEPQSIVWNTTESVDEALMKKHRRILPCQISVYQKLLALHATHRNAAEYDRKSVLGHMVDAYAINVSEGESTINVVFSRWNSGSINLMQHSVERANMGMEILHTEHDGYIALLYCLRDIDVGEELLYNYFSLEDSTARCLLLCKQKNIPTHPVFITNTWSEIRSACNSIYQHWVNGEREYSAEITKLSTLTPTYLEYTVAGIMLTHLFRYVLKKEPFTMELLIKKIKEYPGLMKSLGSVRDIVVKRLHPRWAFERSITKRKIYVE